MTESCLSVASLSTAWKESGRSLCRAIRFVFLGLSVLFWGYLPLEGVADTAKFPSALAGEYAGLFLPATGGADAVEGYGVGSLSVTSIGSFSCKLQLAGKTFVSSGVFDSEGRARFGKSASEQLVLSRTNEPSLSLAFRMDLTGVDGVSGRLLEESGAGLTERSTVVLARVFYDGKTSSQTLPDSQFTVAILCVEQANGLKRSDFPRGSGVGTFTYVSRTGTGMLVLSLADGTPVSVKCRFNKRKEAVFYVPLYLGAGQISGRLVWDEGTSDFDLRCDAVKWHKPQLNGHYYPMGWPEGLVLPLIGTRFQKGSTGSLFKGASSELSPNVILQFSGGGLNKTVTKGMRVYGADELVGVPASDSSFKATVNRGTGEISGQGSLFVGQRTYFKGVILNKGTNWGVHGFFLSPQPLLADGSGKAGKFSVVIAGHASAQVVISEFMPKNRSGIRDEEGNNSDWIEIYNPGKGPISLAGWYLTDDPEDLTKWMFPSVTLAPEEFLVVWATGRNRVDPVAPLHTNFSLHADGEYLGLVRPDGETVEFEYGAKLAGFESDESYGLDFGGMAFVGKQGQGRFWAGLQIPDRGWTKPEFFDAAWRMVRGGVGFGGEKPGILVRQVVPSERFGGINQLKKARDLLSLPKGDLNLANEKTEVFQTLNFLGEGDEGRYEKSDPPPIVNANSYVIEAKGFFYISEPEVYTFGLNSDDGGSIAIDGVAVMTDDTNHGPEDHLSAPRNLTAGWHSIEVVMWEWGGGDEVELFAAKGAHAAWNEAFNLMGSPLGIPLWCLPEDAGTGPVETHVGAALKGNAAAVFLRYGFQLADEPALASLLLSVAYQDGFIAYLNGTELARRNAPESGTLAEAARSDEAGRTFEVIDVSSQKALLKKGKNVLSLVGFRASADNASFALVPRLTGYRGLTGRTLLFSGNTESGDASPGATNESSRVFGKIGPMTFSAGRGVYQQPFDVVIDHEIQAINIRYTLDGSTPSSTHGMEYKGPIRISKTTVLRCLAWKLGYEDGVVETQTYLFPDDVLRQSPGGQPPGTGWPKTRVNGQVFEYGMDPRVVNHTDPAVGGVMRTHQALAALPSVSVVTDLKNLFDPVTGIWVNAGERGDSWERPASVELIGDQESKRGGFQINCGIRIRGGYSRSGDNPKHGLMLKFRGAYEGNLRYPLFGGDGAEEFEQLDLRTAQNYSWSFGYDVRNTFLREETARELQGLMGHPHSRVRYFHLFLNGQYWGIYSTDERPNKSFASSYMGGSEADYDVVKAMQEADYTTGVLDGNLDAWRTLWEKTKKHKVDPSNQNFFSLMGLASDGATPTGEPCLLDLNNLIDYLLLNFWIGNFDGCTSAFLGEERSNNWFGIRDRNGSIGFRFIEHDAEHSMFDINENRTGPFFPRNETSDTPTYERLEYYNPMFMHMDLLQNAEYRMKWADRVQKHLFDGGALTAESVQRVITRFAKQLDVAIIAESARWGDEFSSGRKVPLTRLNWLLEKDYLLKDYVPARGAIVLSQLQEDGLYPRLNAPRANHKEGVVSRGTELGLTADGGTIWYTLDGADPRDVGGGVHSGAKTYVGGVSAEVLLPKGAEWRYLADGSNQGTAWRTSSFNDGSWSTGRAEFGYGDGDEQTGVSYVDTNPLVEGVQRNATTYFRREFALTGKTDVASALITAKYDDALIVYVNGEEVVRTPNISSNPSFDQYASSQCENEGAFFEFAIPKSVLKEGVNVIAAEVHQVSPDSSDVSFDLALQVSKVQSSTPLVLDSAGKVTLKARALSSGEWSALLKVDYEVLDLPNLKIFAAPVSDLAQGGTGVVELNLFNQGNAAASAKIKLEGRLPAGLSGIALSGSGWVVGSGMGSAISATYTGTLTIGESAPPLHLKVAIDSAAARQMDCIFTVAGGGDRTVADNTFVARILVGQTGWGVVSLGASEYRVRHEDGGLSIRVFRTGNVSGSASVRLKNKDGSAKQGADYTAVDQVLEFADGDSMKEVQIGIQPNGADEANEFFEVNLEKVSGAALGGPSSAKVSILASDDSPPSLMVDTPAAGQAVRGLSFKVNGVARDNREVARVEVKLNEKKFVEAKITKGSQRTPFEVELSPKVGLNKVELRSFDQRGNESAHVVRSFQFTQLKPLVLAVLPAGSGSVALSPADAVETLEVGKVYSAMALPKPGMLFAGWSAVGLVPSSVFANPLSFTMQKGLKLTANFMPSPISNAEAGVYSGLITSAEGVSACNANHGFVQMTLTSSGNFSGNVKLDGQSFAFSGWIAPGGTAYFSRGTADVLKFPRFNRPSLRMVAKLDVEESEGPVISGTLGVELRTGAAPFAQFSMNRAAYDGKAPVSSVQVRVIEVKLDAPSANGGVAFPTTEAKGKVSLSRVGLATFVATLADGTKMSASAPLAVDDSFAAYSTLYSNSKGSLGGRVFTKGLPDSADLLSPAMSWFRPYLSAGGPYTFGWDQGLQVPMRRAAGSSSK